MVGGDAAVNAGADWVTPDATTTDRVEVAVNPSVSVTVRETEYVPAEVYTWVGVTPVTVADPSPGEAPGAVGAPGTVEPISRFFKLAAGGLSNTLRAGTDAGRNL